MKNLCLTIVATLTLAACMAADEPLVDQEQEDLSCAGDSTLYCCADTPFHSCCVGPGGAHCYGG